MSGGARVRRFGELESAIMEAVWAADGPVLVRQVVARLRAERDLAYTTVQTVMDILYRKGWLDRQLEGRAYRYWAKESRADYVAGLMREALEESEDRVAALARFVAGMDAAEAAELRAALEAERRREASR